MSLTLNFFFQCVRYALEKFSCNDVFLKVKQLIILESLLLGRDTIAILPTGYGKSIIFHLLPFLFERYHGPEAGERIVLVVAPLNSIIFDQLKELNKRGIKSGVLKAKCEKRSQKHDVKLEEQGEVEGNVDVDDVDNDINEYFIEQDGELSLIQSGSCRIVFTHPEAFISCKEGRKLLRSDVYQQRVVAYVIDEAHIMIEWGHDFRVDYSRLCVLASIFPHSPVVVLTATAPTKHIKAIKNILVIGKSKTVIGDLDRPNIYLEKKRRKPARLGAESYESVLLPFAMGLRDMLVNYPLTIIYLPLKWCGYAYKFFLEVLGNKSHYPHDGIKNSQTSLIAQYHAPQTAEMKAEILRQLTGDSSQSVIRVVFATVAIGLGVNIPNVRQVVHCEVPRTMESYYQEIGRAGRDGKPAKAILYFNATDIAPNKPGMTEEMRNFCLDEDTCMRKCILSYLGSKISNSYSANNCCSNCQENTDRTYLSATSISLVHDPLSEEKCHPSAVRVTTQEQRVQLLVKLKQYRRKLGSSRCKFGSIDLNTGVTLQLLSEITAKCEYVSSAEDMYNLFQIWDITDAHAIYDIIQQVHSID